MLFVAILPWNDRMDVADYIHAEFTARGRWHDCLRTLETSRRPSVGRKRRSTVIEDQS